MAKKPRIKKPKLTPLKKKIKGEVYVGNQIEKMKQEIDSLTKQRDSLQRKSLDQQKELDSLKQVIKIRVK